MSKPMESLDDYENADTISIDTLILEEMVQEERAKEISHLNNLSKKVCYLHTSLLYYRNSKSKMGVVCYEAWKVLVKKVGGTPNGWRDLGYFLGITQDDLNYIMNSVRDDPVDVVLKVFMQNEKSTLDKILDAFVEMKRYDILKAIEDPLSNLAQFFNKDDSGYQSNSKNNSPREIISLTKNLPDDLPPALNKNVLKEQELNKRNRLVLRSPIRTKGIKSKNNNPILFLTFMEDGLQTVLNIQNYVDNWLDIEVDILILNDNKEELYENPEKFIREHFEKCDFVVPILTSSYINAIRSDIASTDDNLDYKYVNFIYNLIVNNYIHASGCMNKKVRSVLPENVEISVLRDITMYPDLVPWTHETQFEENFKAFLKKE